MTKRTNSLVQLVTAATLGLSGSLLPALAATRSTPIMTNDYTVVDETKRLIEKLQQTIPQMAERLALASHKPSNKQSSRDLQSTVLILQQQLNAYLEETGLAENNPPLKADGQMGQRTAEALITFAVNERIDSLFVKPVEQDAADEHLDALRTRLQSLSPDIYTEALRSYAFALIQRETLDKFYDCAAENTTDIPPMNRILEELKNLQRAQEDDYTNTLIPAACTKLKSRLTPEFWYKAQEDYLLFLRGKSEAGPKPSVGDRPPYSLPAPQ